MGASIGMWLQARSLEETARMPRDRNLGSSSSLSDGQNQPGPDVTIEKLRVNSYNQSDSSVARWRRGSAFEKVRDNFASEKRFGMTFDDDE